MSRWHRHWRRRRASHPHTMWCLGNSLRRCNRPGRGPGGLSSTSLRVQRRGARPVSHRQGLHRSRQMCLNISMCRAPGVKCHPRGRASNSLRRSHRPHPMVPGRGTGPVPEAGDRLEWFRGGVVLHLMVDCRARCYRALHGSRRVPDDEPGRCIRTLTEMFYSVSFATDWIIGSDHGSSLHD